MLVGRSPKRMCGGFPRPSAHAFGSRHGRSSGAIHCINIEMKSMRDLGSLIMILKVTQFYNEHGLNNVFQISVADIVTSEIIFGSIIKDFELLI